MCALVFEIDRGPAPTADIVTGFPDNRAAVVRVQDFEEVSGI